VSAYTAGTYTVRGHDYQNFQWRAVHIESNESCINDQQTKEGESPDNKAGAALMPKAFALAL